MIKHLPSCLFFTLCSAFASTYAIELPQPAELAVIHKTSGAVSALRYYDSLSIQSSDKAVQPLPSINFNPDMLREDLIDSLFPVVSHLITPGSVQSRTVSAPGLVQPIFLVGYDELSAIWLSQRGSELKQLGAIGLVVNVPHRRAMEELQRAAGDLTLIPVVGDDIAQAVGVSHYPVLLTQSSIEQ